MLKHNIYMQKNDVKTAGSSQTPADESFCTNRKKLKYTTGVKRTFLIREEL